MSFFQSLPNLKKFTSFDICEHDYVDASSNYFKRMYKGIFEFVKGSSLDTVPEYATQNPHERFDLIYVDGNHLYKYAYLDVLNFKAMAHKNTILMVDDVAHDPIKHALNDLQTQGHIKIEGVYHSEDSQGGGRDWMLARYLVQ